MDVCAYCDKSADLTKEHLIPKWLYNVTKHYDWQTIDRVKNKTIDAEVMIGDVCANCNNIILGNLDAKAKELFHKYFENFIEKDHTISFSYDFDLLTRWLLKLAFNSSRVHKSTQDYFIPYKPYIIGQSNLALKLALCVYLVFPTEVEGKTDAERKIYPEAIRFARIQHSDYEQFFDICNLIAINSFYFILLSPKDKNISANKWNELVELFLISNPSAVQLLPQNNQQIISASKYSTLDVMKSYLVNNKDRFTGK